MSSDDKSESSLDGLTILRFAHAFETGGGVESYLEDLDGVLLKRNAMTVIRIYLASDPNQLAERTEQIGRGRLIRAPFPIPEGEYLQLASDDEPYGINVKHLFRNFVLYNPLVWGLFTKKLLTRRRLPIKKGQAVGVGARFADLINRYPVDLIMLHYFGGSDADEIIELARKRSLPFGLLNHFSNDRFLHLSIRKHAMLAHGVAGVSAIGVPKYLRHRFRDLADGINTEFLKRENSNPPTDRSGPPVILLPARVVRPKGHLDLIKAGAILKKKGLDFRLAFAGRIDSDRFEQELRGEIVRCNLSDKVQFFGVLSQEKLRDCYAASTLVAFPTYHHEGLPRVILEAQAMKVPPVAYATGGVPEGLIPDRTGFLLRKGDVEGLANKLEELLRNKEMCQRMGEEGRRFIEERFSLDALARRHEEFYLSVISSTRNSG